MNYRFIAQYPPAFRIQELEKGMETPEMVPSAVVALTHFQLHQLYYHVNIY
jgi:hypothetical protein